jgi:parallel beta-helix repeat protein
MSRTLLLTLTLLLPLFLFGCAAPLRQLQGAPHRSSEATGETTAGAITLPTPGFASCQGKPTEALPSFNFSRVGYHSGAALPDKAATKTYGQGRYTLASQIKLKSGDVLRGAGRDQTILYFPGGLKQMGFLCANGEKITVTGGGTGDCFDWTHSDDKEFLAVIGGSGSEIGIEDLTIEFPADHAWTHHSNYNGTSGYNGIDLLDCTNCWVKNVTIKNADNGIFITDGSNNTVAGVYVYMRPGGGHTAIAPQSFSHDNLITNFRVYGTSFHGLVGGWGVRNIVFANGWGENVDIEPDHSCGGKAPASACTKNMLYSNISGTIRRFQTTDRSRSKVPAIRWNVGSVDRCPLDVYTAQKEQLIGMTTRRRGDATAATW